MSVSFQDDVLASTPRLRELVGQVLEAVCGSSPEIADICAALDLHRKLAWQLRRFAYCTDLFRAARLAPTASGLRALMKAAEARGVDPAILAELEAVSKAHEQIVEIHAGDRATLDVLAEGCSSDPDGDFEARLREQAFHGNAFIWGVRCRVFYSMMVQTPSRTKPKWFDCAQIRGLYNLQRMRPNVRWTFNQSVVMDDAERQRLPQREPLDAASAEAHDGVPILGEFCSSPSSVQRRVTSAGHLQDEIMPGPVGQVGEEQIVTGEVIRDLAPAHATAEDKIAHFGAAVRLPCESFIIDLIVHRDLFPDADREVCVFGEINDVVSLDESDLLPVIAPIEHLGRCDRAARPQEIPRYSELMRDVFARLELAPEDFELYRVAIRYPPMPASVMIRHELPPESAVEPVS